MIKAKFKSLQIALLSIFSLATMVSCGPGFKTLSRFQTEHLIQYSKNLNGDVRSVKKSDLPLNGTLVAGETDATEVTANGNKEGQSIQQVAGDSCGTIESLIEKNNGEVTDQAILDFHKCKITSIIATLKELDKSKVPKEIADTLDNQIAELEKLLEKLKSDKTTQDQIIAGTRKLIEAIKNGDFQKMLEEAQKNKENLPPLPTAKERCDGLQKALSGQNGINVPDDLKELMQKDYDTNCKEQK